MSDLEQFEADWSALRQHLARGGIIVVSPELDLMDVARRVVADEMSQVAGWIEEGLVARPSELQISTWDRQPAQPFRFVIAQPYVLIQETPQ